ncbi:ABC transporter permease [Rhodovibrionaceae bacterium A322]
MKRYFLQRVLLLLAILIGVLTVTFVVSRVLPGSPLTAMLGPKPTAEQVAAAESALGLNQPIWEQFARYIWQVVQGDFGQSLKTGQPVIEDLALRFTATLELVTLSILLAVLIGLPIGITSAVRRNQPVDHLSRGLSLTGVAAPVFFLAILLQLFFHGWLNLLPLQGRIDSLVLLDHAFPRVTGFYLIDSLLAGQFQAFGSALAHLALPVLTLTLATLAIVVRVSRNTMVEVLASDHIRTARAYGLPAALIHYRYAFKATLIPFLTIVGLTYGYMLGGSVIVEYVFDWPGLGGYIVGALFTNDFPAVMGATVVLSASYLFVNLLVDLLYFWVDPRLSVA